MKIVTCGFCYAKNRVPGFRLGARATCGKCRLFLPEPKWLTDARDLRTGVKSHWIFFTVGISVLAAFAFLPIFNEPKNSALAPVLGPSAQALPIVPTAPIPSPARDYFVGAVAPLKLDHVNQVATCAPKRVRSGAMHRYVKGPAHAPLRITTPLGENYSFILSPVGTDEETMALYVAGGDTKSFSVPDGTYDITFSTGKTWCGFAKQFGDAGAEDMQLSETFVFFQAPWFPAKACGTKVTGST